MCVEDITTPWKLTTLDCQNPINFNCSKNNHLSASGFDLKNTDRVNIQY